MAASQIGMVIAHSLLHFSRVTLLRAVLVLGMFTVFQSLLMLKQANAIGGSPLSGTYYYGALFPVFFLLVVGLTFSQIRFRWALPGSLALAWASASWFLALSPGMIATHNQIYAECSRSPKQGPAMHGNGSRRERDPETAAITQKRPGPIGPERRYCLPPQKRLNITVAASRLTPLLRLFVRFVRSSATRYRRREQGTLVGSAHPRLRPSR
jgi:hypothetical protein